MNKNHPICPGCGKPILDEPITRNKKHHALCVKKKKLDRSKAEYESRRAASFEEKRTEKLLEAFYLQYGHDAYLPVILLQSAKFNFGLKKFDYEHEGMHVIGIHHYGYILFKDNRFKIVKVINHE